VISQSRIILLLNKMSTMEDPTNVIEEVDASSLPSKDANIITSSNSDSKCNMNNFLNALGYIICVVTSYLGGILGWFGGKSNAELNNQYQTLVTPSAVYFQYAWGLIFISEGFFGSILSICMGIDLHFRRILCNCTMSTKV